MKIIWCFSFSKGKKSFMIESRKNVFGPEPAGNGQVLG
ncbi:hypothetical protein B4135_3667 [Caldibacillus debilis]|uniref:Uncharacterized protein n=1 Tax=Caldibacillus debilis TaxID=301148 RepID=A0A150LAI0_9BACI|nr:hypothetical protein B4135_3667 [Caldibacillus debilis]